MHQIAQLTKVSLLLFARDLRELSALVVFLRKSGVKVRTGTVLRALLNLATEAELLELGLATAHAESQLPKPDYHGASRPTADFPKDDLDKLDRAIIQLAKRRTVASRSFLMRALIRGTSTDAAFIARMERFLQDHPYRSRGRHVSRRER